MPIDRHSKCTLGVKTPRVHFLRFPEARRVYQHQCHRQGNDVEDSRSNDPYLLGKRHTKLLSQPDKASNEGFRDYCILLMLIDTGIRLSELAYLKTDDIDYVIIIILCVHRNNITSIYLPQTSVC